MARLDLRLLGGFQARLGDGPALILPAKPQALLAYLAVRPGQAHPRDKLAALLWGNSADAQARDSLRHAVTLLRKALDASSRGVLIVGGQTYALDPASAEIDVVRFEQGVTGGTPEVLATATALYGGDLLEGLEVGEARFEEWLLAERERFRELAVEGLAKLLAHQTQAGGTDRAIQTATRLLALDPLGEVVHRALMRLYAGQGRRGAALKQYQVCVSVLQRELGAEPEAATKQLYKDILQQRAVDAGTTSAAAAPTRVGPAHSASDAGRPAPPLTPHSTAEMPLVGRDAELGRLRAALEEAARSRAHVVLVVGEAGIGKTHLVEELGVLAVQRSGRAVVGRCYETEQILPFAPWVDAFRAAGIGVDASPADALPLAVRVTLGRLFPELTPPDVDVPHDPDNLLRLFEALSQLAAILAAPGPLLVVLEDLHWADDMTLRFLAFLGRRLPAAPLLVVGTVREEEIAQTPALRRTLDELRPHPAFTSVPIGPLSSADTVHLVRALTRAGTDEGAVATLAAQVWRSSEGNPFVAVETMQGIEQGVVAGAAGAGAVASTVRELILRRLERLSGPARQLAAVPAVANGPLDFALIQRASGLPRADAAEGLEELVRHRVFDGVGEGFDFRHDRIRRVADAGLLAPRRETLHAALGEALEALNEGALAPVYDRLAYHYARTDRTEKAVEYLWHFAEQAARGFAHGEAAAALEQALVHGERLPVATRDARLVELSLRLAFSLSLLGRFRDILTVLGRQRERVDRLDRPDLGGPYHFRVGLTHSYLGEQARAGESARAALDQAQRAGDTATMGRAHYLLALKGYWTGELREGVTRARDAIALLERLERSEERHFLGLAYWVLGLNENLRGEFESALTAVRDLQRVGRALHDPRLQSFAAGSFGWIHATRGDAGAGLAACTEAVDLARDPISHALATVYLGYAHVEHGNAGAGIEALGRAVDEFAQLQIRPLVSRSMVWLADGYLVRGDTKTARRFAEEALALGETVDYWFSIAWARRVLARIALGDGDLTTGESHLAPSLAIFTRVGAAFEVGRTHLIVAELARRGGASSAALPHLAEATRWLSPLDVPRYHARVRALTEP